MNQTLPVRASKSHAILAAAWGTLRVTGRAIWRAVLALIDFWNIPVLGNDETRERRYSRTTYYI